MSPLVPVWLTVPAHADVAVVADDDLVAECRRRGYAVWAVGRALDLPGLHLDGTGTQLRWRGQRAHLSEREADVLRVLAAAHPRGVSCRALAVAVWADCGVDNLPRVYVRYLRQKCPGLIETLPGGRGYRLVLDENATTEAS